MCGIVGFISCDTENAEKRASFFKQALYADTLRGEDSTGLFGIDKSHEMGLIKMVLPGYDFLTLPKVNKLINHYKSGKALIGHNRFKTTGAIEVGDAHPHTFEDITLVHNGTITNSFNLPGISYVASEPSVDSFRVAKSLALNPALEVLPKLEGGYALVWWDARVNKLYMARNDEKPYSWAWSENKKTLYMASEWLMLNFILERNNIPTVKNKIYEPKPLTLFEFTIDKDQVAMKKTEYKVEPKKSYFAGPARYQSGAAWEREEKTDIKTVTFPKQEQVLQNSPPLDICLLPQPGLTAEEMEKNRPKYSAQKLDKVKENLAALGLELNETIYCSPVHWFPFKGRALMGIGGYRWHEKKAVVRAFNISKNEWDQAAKGKLFVPLKAINVDKDGVIIGDIDWKNLSTTWDYVSSLDERDEEIHFIPGPEGKLLNLRQWAEYTKAGCIFCQCNLSVQEYDTLEWVDGLPLCETCGGEYNKGLLGVGINGAG